MWSKGANAYKHSVGQLPAVLVTFASTREFTSSVNKRTATVSAAEYCSPQLLRDLF